MARKIEQGLVEKIVAMYPTMTCPEIAAELGISKKTVSVYSKRLGLKHTAETIARIRESQQKGQRAWRTSAEAKKARAEAGRKLSKLWRMEKWRVRSGMEQVSRLRVSVLPKKTMAAIYRLTETYGYLYATGNLTLWYDAKTRRNPLEQYYTDKYGIHFEPDEKE